MGSFLKPCLLLNTSGRPSDPPKKLAGTCGVGVSTTAVASDDQVLSTFVVVGAVGINKKLNNCTLPLFNNLNFLSCVTSAFRFVLQSFTPIPFPVID